MSEEIFKMITKEHKIKFLNKKLANKFSIPFQIKELEKIMTVKWQIMSFIKIHFKFEK